RVQRRSCLASADIFADEMGLSDRNVEFGWWLARIIRRVFDYETLLSGRRLCFSDFRRFRSQPDRQHLQSAIASDAVLQMDHKIPLFQLSEINVQSRARRLRMRGFQPARTLNLITAEYLCVGNDNQFAFVIKKASCQSANVQRGVFRSEPILCPNL